MLKRLLKRLLRAAGLRVMRERTARHLERALVDAQTAAQKTFSGGTLHDRGEHAWIHPRPINMPEIDVVVTEPDSRDDGAIVSRLISAFTRAVEDEKKAAGRNKDGDFWGTWTAMFHSDLAAALKARDAAAVADQLGNMFQRPITHGLGHGAEAFTHVKDPVINRQLAGFFLDKLIALAEAVAVLPHENPEQGRWDENMGADPDEVARDVERRVGFPIAPPQVGGTYGIPANGGVFHFRDINSIYTAWRIGQIAGRSPLLKVCEIGGGFGGLAWYVQRMRKCSYTVVDLPVINVLQGYYLLKAGCRAPVRLYGENAPGEEEAVVVLPYWCFGGMEDGSFDLTVNQDSFPEISRENVIGYLKAMRRNTRSYFLSINQESQGKSVNEGEFQQSVPDLVRTVGGFDLVGRFPYWIRKGYVEELYRIAR